MILWTTWAGEDLWYRNSYGDYTKLTVFVKLRSLIVKCTI